jgi:LysM repeat protein
MDAYDLHTTTCPHSVVFAKSDVCTFLRMKGHATDVWSPQSMAFPMQRARYDALLVATDAWAAQFALPTADGKVRHCVEMGDTMAGLAVRYNTTPSAIKLANRLGFGGGLHALQSVVIPVSYADTPPPETQTGAFRPAPEQLYVWTYA